MRTLNLGKAPSLDNITAELLSTTALEKKINAFKLKVFRRLLIISWRDFISNEEVRRRLADLLSEDNPLDRYHKEKEATLVWPCYQK